MIDRINNPDLELQKQKTINYLIGETIKYATNLETLDISMDKIVDMLTGILGLSAITIHFNDSLNNRLYCRSIEDNEVTTSCSYFEKSKATNSIKLITTDTDSTLYVALKEHTENNDIGYIYVRSNNSEFFDSSILSFFEILAIQIPIIISNALLFEKMKHDSIKDILTNSYNRKHLTYTLNKIVQEKIQSSLAFFDLDNFKFINDTFGHSIGDRVLIDISEIAISYCKKYNGQLFRYGGDEFIMLLYNATLEKTEEIFNLLRRDIMVHLSSNLELDIKQTITIGISNYPETVENPECLLNAADSALVKGKLKQKNTLYIGYEKNTEEN